jgi:hypothetical protein
MNVNYLLLMTNKMTKLKQSNIFDYYAPLNGGTKIADFSSALKNAAASTKTVAPTNDTIGSSPNITSSITSASEAISVAEVAAATINSSGDEPKKDNTWIWVLVGLAAIGGGIYLIHRHIKKKEEEEKKR